MLELFVQLYRQSLKAQKLETDIEEDRNRLAIIQFFDDRNNIELERLQTETRADYTEVVEKYTSDLPSVAANRANIVTWLEGEQASRENAVNIVNQLWPQVYERSQAYFNICLDANFKEAWSLHRDACINMRKRLVDPYTLMLRNRKRVHQLKYRLVLVRSEKRGLALKASCATLSVASRNLNAARVAELTQDEQNLESELFPQQALLTLREGKLQQSQTNAIRDLVEPFLETAGRLPLPDDGPDAESGGEDPQPADSPTGFRPNSASPPSSGGPDETADEDLTLEDLVQRYTTAQLDLEILQRQLGAEQLSFRGVFKEVDHILTFTNLSPERYAVYVARCSREGIVLQTAAEARVETARDALLAAGGDIPQATARSQNRSPRSRRTTDTARVRNLRRRPVNDYRFSQRPVSPASVSSRSRSSIPEFGTTNSRGETASLSPSPGRDQTLEEYMRQQEIARDQEELRRQG